MIGKVVLQIITHSKNTLTKWTFHCRKSWEIFQWILAAKILFYKIPNQFQFRPIGRIPLKILESFYLPNVFFVNCLKRRREEETYRPVTWYWTISINILDFIDWFISITSPVVRQLSWSLAKHQSETTSFVNWVNFLPTLNLAGGGDATLQMVANLSSKIKLEQKNQDFKR